MNLNDLLRNEYLQTGNLIVYDLFIGGDQHHFLGSPKNEISNIGIVIQGGIGDTFTLRMALKTIKRYKLSYPNSKIILSTWNSVNKEYLDSLNNCVREYNDVYVILNEQPSYAGAGNGNLQILSTLNGAKFAQSLGVEYILKTRTDQFFADYMFIDQLLTLHKTFTERLPRSQKGRIVVGSMGSFRARPFCVGDFFSFGFTEDIITMWDLELDANGKNLRDIFIKERSGNEEKPMNEEDVCHLNYVSDKKRCGEGYFASNLLDKAGLSYSYDWKDSEGFSG